MSSYNDFQNSLRKRFGDTPFAFFDRGYLIDWAASFLLWLAAWYIKGLPPFERDFSTKDDLIDHKHRPNQISGGVNWLIAFMVPIVVALILGIVRGSICEMHHGVLAIHSGRGLTVFITEALKNRVGRLRPDFLHRCKWDKNLKACTGDLDKVLDGRRSFPSGHSSTAFAGMTFLALYLAGLTGAWCVTQPVPGSSLSRSKLLRLLLTLCPLGFATWVAVSRVEDYRHHKEDVIVGSLLGIACATICYLIYWPNPFTTSPLFTARTVYGGAEGELDRVRMPNPQRYGYELAGLNEPVEQTV